MGIVMLPPIKSAAEIWSGSYPEPRYLCELILPEVGLGLIVGPKACGKTQLALAIAAAVAGGGTALGSLPCTQAKVLFIELELAEAKIHRRLHRMDLPCPTNFDFANEWPQGANAVTAIEEAIERYGYRLIVIDVMQRVWSTRSDPNQYHESYRELAPYRELANRKGVTLLMLTHTRKQKDVVSSVATDVVLGSVGIVGNADAILMIQKTRGRNEGVLHVVGNDIPDIELAMRFDEQTTRWLLSGDHPAVGNLTPERKAVYEFLLGHGKAKTGEIAAKLKKSDPAISNLLKPLTKAGLVEQVGYGEYKAVSFATNHESSESEVDMASELSQDSSLSSQHLRESASGNENPYSSNATPSFQGFQEFVDESAEENETEQVDEYGNWENQ